MNDIDFRLSDLELRIQEHIENIIWLLREKGKISELENIITEHFANI